MKKAIKLFGFYVLLLCLCGCGNKVVDIVFNPYVEAFSSGQISKTERVGLVFSQAIDSVSDWQDALQISPSNKGEWQLSADRKSVFFVPRTPWTPGKTYRVDADIDALFGAEDPDKQFSFNFSAMPWAACATFGLPSVLEGNVPCYTIHLLLSTADSEDSKTVESCGSWSNIGSARVSWTHSANGRRHEACIEGITATNEFQSIAFTYPIDAQGNKETVNTTIPDKSTFLLWKIRTSEDNPRVVELVFNQNLSENQDLTGLVSVQDNPHCAMDIKGNVIRLFLAKEASGTCYIQLSAGIESRSGMRLETGGNYAINLANNKPYIQFLSDGNILPLSDKISIPFKAQYLRGVVVRVIRVPSRNMGQFLQTNNLGDGGEMMRTGRLVARRILFFDEESIDLSKPQVFALDLGKLIQVEPGALYRIILSTNIDLSAFPGIDKKQASKEELLRKNQLIEAEEMSKFDREGYYYYFDDLEDDYNWRDSDNPTKPTFYSSLNCNLNVLATNLAVCAAEGSDNELHVWTSNLINGEAESGVDIKVYNYQGEELAMQTSDHSGHAVLSYSYSKPFYLIASKGKSTAYLRLDNASSLSTSQFDVSGSVIENGTNGYIYGDRGVWRPGDTLHLGFVINNRIQKLPAQHPVTLTLTAPTGQLFCRTTRSANLYGLCCFNIPLPSDAPTGAWHASITVGGASFEKTLRVETIKPNRLKIDLRFKQALLKAGDNVANLHCNWLNGGISGNLRYDIQTSFKSNTTKFKNYADYLFDDPGISFQTVESPLQQGQLDEKGNALVNLHLENSQTAPGMLKATITTKVYETGGDFSINVQQTDYSPYTTYIGVKGPKPTTDILPTGQKHTFQVVSLTADGQPIGGIPVRVQIFKTSWYWWWNATESTIANYLNDTYNEPVFTDNIVTGSKGTCAFNYSVKDEDWGVYYLRFSTGNNGHSCGTVAFFDVVGAEHQRNSGSQSATLLPLSADKDCYQPGETAHIRFQAPLGSRAIINIENGSSILSTKQQDVDTENTEVDLPITAQMHPNIYVHITLLQAYTHSNNDSPIRLYGILPLRVDNPDSRLEPSITAPTELQPGQSYTVSVSESKGRAMSYTLAIVDEGLLQLTNFKTPDPWKAFNAREALGVRSWDNYNHILGAYGGQIEQLFSIGGDDVANWQQKTGLNRFAPVVIFKGPFTLKKGEKRTHSFKMPNYNGTVRMMVIATNGEAFGSAEKNCKVSQSLMVLGSLPRTLGTNESVRVPVTLITTKANLGKATVSLKVSDNVQLIGNATQTVDINRIGEQTIYFNVNTGSVPGSAIIQAVAKAGVQSSTWETALSLASRDQRILHSETLLLAPGETKSFTPKTIGYDNQLVLETSTLQALNLAGRLNELCNYPHHCLEQTCSKIIGQISAEPLEKINSQQQASRAESIKTELNRLRSYQTAEGGMAYWPGNRKAHDWGSAYALLTLYVAEQSGYQIPDGMFKSLLAYVKKQANSWQPDQNNNYYNTGSEIAQAYRLYALAVCRHAVTGAMSRMKEQERLCPTSCWLLSTAYAFIGRSNASESLWQNRAQNDTNEQFDFAGNTEQTAWQVIALTVLGRNSEAATLVERLSEELASNQWMSTLDIATALFAISHYATFTQIGTTTHVDYAYNNQTGTLASDSVMVLKTILEEHAANLGTIKLHNKASNAVYVNIQSTGSESASNIAAYSEGVSITVNYTDAQGKPLQVEKMNQGTNFTAVINIHNNTSLPISNLVVEQLLPSGWEILNSRFADDGGNADNQLSYQDIRDDRVYSYIDRLSAGSTVCIPIKLCATYQGRYQLPALQVSAMYNNKLRANTSGSYTLIQ